MQHLHHILLGRKRFLITAALVTGLLAGIFSLLTEPLKYSAEVRLLITQRAAFTLDPYTAIRSTELIGDHLSQVVTTSSFLEKVLEPQYQIDRDYFSGSERVRRRLWTKTVEVDQERGSGLLRVRAFHPRREEAIKMVNAVAFLLSTQGGEYVGREITVRLVDAPLASRFPVKPNIPLNVAVGAMLGALGGAVWIIGKDRRRKRHLRGQERRADERG